MTRLYASCDRPAELEEAKRRYHDNLLLIDGLAIDAYVVVDEHVDALLVLLENGYVLNYDMPYIRIVRGAKDADSDR